MSNKEKRFFQLFDEKVSQILFCDESVIASIFFAKHKKINIYFFLSKMESTMDQT